MIPRAPAAILVVLILALASCGSDDDEGGGGGSEPASIEVTVSEQGDKTTLEAPESVEAGLVEMIFANDAAASCPTPPRGSPPTSTASRPPA